MAARTRHADGSGSGPGRVAVTYCDPHDPMMRRALIRPGFKFMAHATFAKAPELRPYLIPIRFDGDIIAFSEIETMRDRQYLLDFLRSEVYRLAPSPNR